MNIISHNAAYAFFPHESFNLYESLNCGNGSNTTRDARLKYERRGWTMHGTLPLKKMSDFSNDFQAGERFAGDNKCWTIPLAPIIANDTSSDDCHEHWIVSYSSDRVIELYVMFLYFFPSASD